MDWKLGKQTKRKYDDYVHETFESFCNHKKEISLNLEQLDNAKDKDMASLVMYDIKKGDEEKDVSDKTNLCRPEILTIFENIKSLSINTGNAKYGCYSLSLLGLLPYFKTSPSLQQITIKSRKDKNDNNWISSLWSSSSQKLQQTFNAKHYEISMKEENSGRVKEDWLMIVKM